MTGRYLLVVPAIKDPLIESCIRALPAERDLLAAFLRPQAGPHHSCWALFLFFYALFKEEFLTRMGIFLDSRNQLT